MHDVLVHMHIRQTTISNPAELSIPMHEHVPKDAPEAPRWPHHPVLGTHRFVFRPLRVGDLQELMDIARGNRRSDATIGFPQPCDPEFVRTWMTTSDPSTEAVRTLHWATLTLNERELVGYTALARIDLQRSQAELRLWVGVGSDRDDTALEWARRMINFAVDRMHIQRIYSLHLIRNRRAERILTGVGMQFDGIVRKRISRNAQMEDTICRSIWADDWQTLR